MASVTTNAVSFQHTHLVRHRLLVKRRVQFLCRRERLQIIQEVLDLRHSIQDFARNRFLHGLAKVLFQRIGDRGFVFFDEASEGLQLLPPPFQWPVPYEAEYKGVSA